MRVLHKEHLSVEESELSMDDTVQIEYSSRKDQDIKKDKENVFCDTVCQ
jgi:hypothetical protein